MTGKEKKLTGWFFNLIGVFNHYTFFTDELWRNVKGFKNVDEAEIKAAFMHYWFHNEFEYWTCPCGNSWFVELDNDSYYPYIYKYKNILDAFENWKIQQR